MIAGLERQEPNRGMVLPKYGALATVSPILGRRLWIVHYFVRVWEVKSLVHRLLYRVVFERYAVLRQSNERSVVVQRPRNDEAQPAEQLRGEHFGGQ